MDIVIVVITIKKICNYFSVNSKSFAQSTVAVVTCQGKIIFPMTAYIYTPNYKFAVGLKCDSVCPIAVGTLLF